MHFFLWLCSYVDIIVFIIEYGTYKEVLLKNILANNKLGHKACVFRSRLCVVSPIFKEWCIKYSYSKMLHFPLYLPSYHVTFTSHYGSILNTPQGLSAKA